MKLTCMLFDVDGTLLDTRQGVLQTLQQVVFEETGKRYTLSELSFAFGLPSRISLPRLGIINIERAMQKWDNSFHALSKTTTRLFEGVRETLGELYKKGITMGVITSKCRLEYQTDVPRFGLDPYFSGVICSDDVDKPKPSGQSILKFMEGRNLLKEQVLYIGDTDYDARCAKDAGVKFALATWGTSLPMKSDIPLTTFKDLLQWV